MKKILYSALSILVLAGMTAQAQVLMYEPFTYPDGVTTTVSGGKWVRHSGGNNDSFVSSNRLQVFGTRTDDVNRGFTGNVTNTNSIFAAFTLNMSSLPVNSNGTYFAHFKDNGFNFHGRIFAVTGNDGFVPNFSVTPGYFRLGVANANGDGTGAITAGPTAVVPMDLALNTDYQVVVQYDPATGAQLWVNPLNTNDVGSGMSVDTSAASTNGVSAYAFRQNTGQGQQTVDNLVVGDTFADVVTNVAFGPPFFANQPVGTTNYSGNPFSMSTDVSGRGALTYQWYLGGNAISGASGTTGGAATITYSIASLGAGDDGTYTLVVSNSYGSSVTSVPTVISVNTTPTAPFVATQPSGVTNQISSNVTLSPTAGGSGPLSYQWMKDGNPAPGPDANNLVYHIIQATTNDSGTYNLVVSGPGGPNATSANAVVLITPAQSVTMAFLRSLEDTNTWAPTNTTTLFSVTGTVVNPNSPTTSTTSSYYLQDATGGINLFITGTSTFRPALGAIVTAVGPIANFNGNLELSLNTANQFHTFSDTGLTNALPAPFVISFTNTNNVAFMESKESTLIMLTNVYFKTPGTNFFTNGGNYLLTNSAGVTFVATIGSIVSNLNGVAIPPFAWTLTGVLIQNNNNVAANPKAGYQIMLSLVSDVTSNAPSRPTVSAVKSAGNVSLTWAAQPYHYAYTVQSSANVNGPYSVLATGLVFTNTSGAYTDINPPAGARFYRVSSP